MADSTNDNREDFVMNEGDAEEEAGNLGREEYYRNSGDVFRKKSALPFIIGGVGLIVLVIIFIIMLSGREDVVDRIA